MTSIDDTAQMAKEPPIPALWATTAFAGIVCLILIFQVIFSFTKLRLVCLIACTATLVLTITNTADTYYPLTLDVIHSLMFAFITILYFDLIIAIFLDIGGAFYHSKDRKTPLFWVVIFLVVSFSLVATGAAITVFFTDASETIALTLCIFAVGACLLGMLGAVAYAFIPLVTNRRIPSRQSDAYAVGIWYLTIVTTIMIGYIIFYAIAFVNFSKSNPLGQVNQGIDYCFRVILVLAYGLPPNRRVIRYIRNNLSIYASRVGTSHAASNHAPWSSGTDEDMQKSRAESNVEILVVPAPVEMTRISP